MKIEELVPAEVFFDHAAKIEDEETKSLLLTAGNQAMILGELLNEESNGDVPAVE